MTAKPNVTKLPPLLDRCERQDSGQSLLRQSDIYRDILALDTEFEEVDIDLKTARTIGTRPNDRAGGHLPRAVSRSGWIWQVRQRPQPYRVVALDPNPAADQRGHHPSPRSGRIAVRGRRPGGDPGRPGRGPLLDFFLLVSQVLHTYGQGSAYVELDELDRRSPCNDCGATTHEDDRYCCHRCDETFATSVP